MPLGDPWVSLTYGSVWTVAAVRAVASLRPTARPPTGTGRAVVSRRLLALPVTQIASRADASSAGTYSWIVPGTLPLSAKQA